MTGRGMVTPETLADRMNALPPMPQAAGRVLRLLEQQDTTADDLRRVIETDPALTGTVLRLVNSALFGMPRQISTLSHAIMLIGFLRLRSLTLTTVAAGLREMIPPDAAAERALIWEHSVDTALGARVIAERLGFGWSEEAFVAGLLHDVGRLVLLSFQVREYRGLVDPGRGALPTPEEEVALLGMDHEQVGRELLRRWRLAPQLVEVCGGHHGDALPRGDHAELAAIVMVADRLLGSASREDPVPPAEALGLGAGDLDRLGEEVRREVADARSVLLAM